MLASAGEAGIDGMKPAEAGPLRMEEERAGAALVGVEDVEFLDHQDGVIEYGLDLRRDLARHDPPVPARGPDHREPLLHVGQRRA